MSLVTDVLDFDSFCDQLLAELEIAPTLITGDTLLAEDLGFDSVLTFELLLVVEEWIGALIPEAMLGQLLTMGDVYDVYRTRVTQQ